MMSQATASGSTSSLPQAAQDALSQAYSNAKNSGSTTPPPGVDQNTYNNYLTSQAVNDASKGNYSSLPPNLQQSVNNSVLNNPPSSGPLQSIYNQQMTQTNHAYNNGQPLNLEPADGRESRDY